MELHQSKNFLHSKGNNQKNEKTTHQMEEHICESHFLEIFSSRGFCTLIFSWFASYLTG